MTAPHAVQCRTCPLLTRQPSKDGRCALCASGLPPDKHLKLVEGAGNTGHPGADAWRASKGDTGCELSPSCLTCPLPRCQYDEVNRLGGATDVKADRNAALVAAWRSDPSLTPAQLGARFGLRPRTVERILQVERERNRAADRTPPA